MKTEEKLNMTMLCDFYELTMGNGYFESGYKDHITYFDVFFRRVPDGGGFAIAAGLEQLIDYIENLHFSPEDIAYLRGRNLFSEEFLSYLEDFHFTGDIYAMPEGTPVFPREPMVIVRAKAIEAQPEPDRHQGQPHRPCRPWPHGAGVRLPPGAGGGCRHHRRPCRLHRRCRRYGLHHL